MMSPCSYFFSLNLVISGFPKGARLTFLCGHRSQLSLQYSVLEESAFSIETSAAQINSELPSLSTHLLMLPSCLELCCHLCLLGIGERRAPGRFI